MKTPLRRARAWLAGVAPLPGWLLVAAAYGTALIGSTEHLRRWGPDARYYLAWAYRYGGLSEREAGRRTYEFLDTFEWFRDFCGPGCRPDDTYAWLFHGWTGGLVAPRVLYPLLSAPFVRAVGPQGMLVVPILAYAVCLVLVMVLAARLAGPRWSVLAGLATVLPAEMSRWSNYAYTEALTMALCVACVVVLPLGRHARRWDPALFGVLLLAFAFTRQFHPVVVAGVGAAWLGAAVTARRLRNPWLPFLAVGVAVLVVANVVQGLIAPAYSIVDSFVRHSGAGSVAGIPGALPRVAWRLIRAEAWDALDDPSICLVGLLVVAGALRRYRSPVTWLVTGALGGTFALHVLNTEPSHLRYYAVVFPLLAVYATTVVADLFGGAPPPAPEPPVPGERASPPVDVKSPPDRRPLLVASAD
ncbi:hypothetical protein [Rhizomonospora bruguierae]|uniref:hypothetical protein n=1 Tax=Rhizomonospora bruguierae TaxID=1581705 RepID=UPI001BCFBD81|nr:hypothetical protein [Micromonospora sp. NBRC 107566]